MNSVCIQQATVLTSTSRSSSHLMGTFPASFKWFRGLCLRCKGEQMILIVLHEVVLNSLKMNVLCGIILFLVCSPAGQNKQAKCSWREKRSRDSWQERRVKAGSHLLWNSGSPMNSRSSSRLLDKYPVNP